MSYLTVAGHRSMALDTRRNAAYGAALQQVVSPDSVVLDLGAGTGIHGLMAARLGARRVYLVEPEDIVSVAAELVRANGLEATVRCLQGRIEDVDLPEPVDVIVSALTGNFLLAEDLLGTLFRARDAHLAPGGCLIPSAAEMEAVPVSAPELHDKEIAGWSAPQQGVDLGAARHYAANSLFFRSDAKRDLPRLADPQTLKAFDFTTDDYGPVHIDASFLITSSGLCHGWLGWFRMRLGDQWLSTSPYEPPMHWSPAFLPLDPPMMLERGEQVRFSLDRVPFGDWTWRVDDGGASQQHSTLLAAPMTAASLAKAARDYQPTLAVDGDVLLQVLTDCDGATTVEAIAATLRARFPARFGDAAEALAFVQRAAKRYTT